MFILKHKLDRGALGYCGGDGGDSASSGNAGSESNMDDSSNTGGTFGSDGGFTAGGDAASQAANSPGGYSTNADGSYSTDEGTYSDNADGSVNFTPAPTMTLNPSVSTPTANKYATSVPGRSKGFNKGYQSALATAKEQSKAAFANPTYNVQQEDMVRGMQPVASPANLLANVTKPATKTPTFFGRPTVNHKDVISQREVQAELDRRAATVGPKGPTVSEIDAVRGGIPGDRPNAELSIIDRGMNIYKGVQNLKRDAVERVSKDIAGLGRALKGEPMEYLGEVAHPTVNIPGVTQSVYSNVPGAHIDSMGRYNTNPDMDYAPSSGQLSQPSDSGGSTTPLRAPSTVAPSTTSPYSAPGVADAPLHNTSAPTYTPRVVMVGGIPHYRDVSGRLVKFMGY